MTIESNNDYQIFSCTQGSVVTAVTELHFAIRQVGCKAQLPNLAVEPPSAIVQGEPLDQRIIPVTEQRFATQAEKPLRLRAPVVIEPRFGRQVAAALARQFNREIRRPSEMPVVVRLDRLPTTATEQHFATALGGRLDPQVETRDRTALLFNIAF